MEVVMLPETDLRHEVRWHMAAPAGADRSDDDLHFRGPTGTLFPPSLLAEIRVAPVAKLVKKAPKTAGITTQLGTNADRRPVVTSLFVDGGEALEDIVPFVGHPKPTTAAGYVKPLGRRPGAAQAGGCCARRPGQGLHTAAAFGITRQLQEQPWEQRHRIRRLGGA